jgi:hypothetical protein
MEPAKAMIIRWQILLTFNTISADSLRDTLDQFVTAGVRPV